MDSAIYVSYHIARSFVGFLICIAVKKTFYRLILGSLMHFYYVEK